MADPVTLTVLGSWAAAEGIKFLYGQAGELLKAWRERRRQKAEVNAADQPAELDAAEQRPAELTVPIIATDVLDAAPTRAVADAGVLDRQHKEMVQLVGALSPYALDQADIDLTDEELADQAGRLRALLEAAYGQRFTFRGEQRDPTGTRVTVSQVLGEVAGTVVGVEATVAVGAEVEVDQQIDKVSSEGSVTGFKGDIGTQ
jgi:MoxR-like ATPase